MDAEDYERFQMEQALKDSDVASGLAMNAPQMAEVVQQQQAVLVAQTDPRKVVRDIILRLQGQEELPDGTRVQMAAPKMNKKGIESVWFKLDSFINDNIRFSSLDEREVTNLIDVLQEDIVDDLSINWRKYGIKNKTDLDDINNSIIVNIYAMLKRAVHQNEKNWIGKISVESISSSSRPQFQPKKSGFLDKFKL